MLHYASLRGWHQARYLIVRSLWDCTWIGRSSSSKSTKPNLVLNHVSFGWTNLAWQWFHLRIQHFTNRQFGHSQYSYAAAWVILSHLIYLSLVLPKKKNSYLGGRLWFIWLVTWEQSCMTMALKQQSRSPDQHLFFFSLDYWNLLFGLILMFMCSRINSNTRECDLHSKILMWNRSLWRE